MNLTKRDFLRMTGGAALAGAKAPETMQGRSFMESLAGRPLPEARDACYCRYYVEGGEHATAAWYGVVTPVDKLVYYYKRDEWEYFRTEKDPDELDNAYGRADCRERVAFLKRRLAELRKELGDDDRYRDVQEYAPRP